jgi:hypothetical protein
MSVLAARLSESYDAHVAAARRLPALVADLPFTVLPCSSVCYVRLGDAQQFAQLADDGYCWKIELRAYMVFQTRV